MAPDTIQDSSQDSSQGSPAIQRTRLPYDVEFLEISSKFSDEVLSAVPELRGIAVVPVWAHPPENCHAGLMRLKNSDPLDYLAELLALLGRLTSFAVEVHGDFVRQLKTFHQYERELSATIKDRLNQLEQLNANADTAESNDNAKQ